MHGPVFRFLSNSKGNISSFCNRFRIGMVHDLKKILDQVESISPKCHKMSFLKNLDFLKTSALFLSNQKLFIRRFFSVDQFFAILKFELLITARRTPDLCLRCVFGFPICSVRLCDEIENA